MSTFTITAKFELREVEPDGSECLGCGDLILLKQYRAFAVFDSGGEMEIKSANLCQSCTE